jgi:hypothetical protein
VTSAERIKLLAQIEQVRANMNAQLDDLAATIAAHSPTTKRRAPLRPPIAGPVLIPDDIARAKARAALVRMRMAAVKR